MAGPLIGSKNACVGVLVVMSKEALTESVAIPVAVQQNTVTVLVVSELVFLTTSLMLLVSEGVTVVLLIKVFHEWQERIRVGGSIWIKLTTEVALLLSRRSLEVTAIDHHLVIVLVVEELTIWSVSSSHLYLLALRLLSNGDRKRTVGKVALERGSGLRLLRTESRLVVSHW